MRRSSRSAWVGMIMAVLVLAATAQVIAETNPSPTYNSSNRDAVNVTGTVTSIDTSGRTITVETPTGPVVYRTDNSSRFMSGGRTIELSGLKTNDRVTLSTTGTGDTLMLSRLEVMPSGMGTGAYNSSNRDAVTGTVTSIDASGRTITVETPTGPVVYRTDNNSRFMSSGRTIELGGLHNNDRVTLYTTGTGDTMMLSRLEVMPAGTNTSSNRDAVPGGTTTASNYNDRNLPRTASVLPLVGLAGLALAGLALSLRFGQRWMH